MLVLRPAFTKDSNVTLGDMLSNDLEWALKVNEYIDIMEAVEKLGYDKIEKQNNKRS